MILPVAVLGDAFRGGYRLPQPRVVRLLVAIDAPPRLVAHLVLVHDTACSILDSLRARWPSLAIDDDAVRFGAATHDIGKALHPAELSGPGALHELAGERWLAAYGEPRLARFARTHAAPPDDRGLTLEDLLVALADKVWKGARVAALEERCARDIAGQLSVDLWDVLPTLLEELDRIAADADARLDWQGSFSAT